ncbi:MAG: hypothetical protein V1689_12525 [Pseudomonadota bacterium]
MKNLVTSFGKKTLTVLCLSFKTLKCYKRSASPEQLKVLEYGWSR